MRNAGADARSRPATPALAATVQTASPSDPPAAVQIPPRRPPARALRTVSAVSGPGVQITMTDTARNASSWVPTARACALTATGATHYPPSTSARPAGPAQEQPRCGTGRGEDEYEVEGKHQRRQPVPPHGGEQRGGEGGHDQRQHDGQHRQLGLGQRVPYPQALPCRPGRPVAG